MEPFWPRRIFLGTLLLTAAFLAVRFAQKKTYTGDFAGAWNAAPGPGPEAPVNDPADSGEPRLSAPQRAFPSHSRVPQPAAMSGPTDLSEEATSQTPYPANAAMEESAYGQSAAASSASGSGAGAHSEAPSVESAAAADGKIPGVRGQSVTPSRPKPRARAAGGSGRNSSSGAEGKEKAAGQNSVTENKLSQHSRPELAARRSAELGLASGDKSRAVPSASADALASGGANASAGKQPAPAVGPGRAVSADSNSESDFQSALASARGALSPAAAPPPVSGRPVPPPVSGRPVPPPVSGRPVPLPARPPEAESGEPMSGGLSLTGGTEGPRRFATDKGKGAVVAVSRLPNGAITFTADMDIVADGAGGHYKADKTGQAQTALLYPDGGSLNPGNLPFIVVPLDFHKTYPDVQLGDFAAVTYNGKTMFAIVGDKGPTGVVGEGSIHLAQSLGINADPNTGGVESGVQYVILPGTRGRIPRESAELQSQARELFQQSGLLP